MGRPTKRKWSLTWRRTLPWLGVIGALAGWSRSALAQSSIVGSIEARRIAEQRGWLVRSDTMDGGAIELMWIVDDIPLYYETHNLDAARTVSTSAVWPGGAEGLGLTGSGVTIGVWDAGRVRATHQEFGTRVTPGDGFPPTNAHATHVAGTIAGAGLSPADGTHPAGQSIGMAYEALVNAYDFKVDEVEMAAAASNGLLISNHSYGVVTGWGYDDFGEGTGWYWFGDVRVSLVEDYFFGFYSFQARRWDDIAYEHPNYLIVKSAGNDRNDLPPPGQLHFVKVNESWIPSEAVRSDDPYDTVSHAAIAKNVLTVGAVADLVGGYTDPASVTMTSYSSWGPTDDGRIKPDIVANGNTLWSATSSSIAAYESRSGTSMAAASTTGSLGLMIGHHWATHDNADMPAALLKGLVIHTADEAGDAPGPDYRFGWGLLNTAAAAAHISSDKVTQHAMQMLTVGQGQAVEQTLTYSGNGPIRVTICWTDPPGTPPPPSLDPPTPVLVNDLDLRVVGPDGTVHEPWRLDPFNPTAPALRGNNNVDTVEMVVIDNPLPGAYTVRVTGAAPLIGEIQPFALLLTGVDSAAPITGACCQLESCVDTTAEDDCLTQGNTWYGGGDCADFSCPQVGACCFGCPPEHTCTILERHQCVDGGGAWFASRTCEETTCLRDGDDCGTDMIVATDGSYPIDNRCASTDGPTPVMSEFGEWPFTRDLWLGYQATCTGMVTVSTCGDADFDVFMAIYTDGSQTCPCPVDATMQDGLAADDTCGVEGGPAILQRWVNQGQCLTVRVGGWKTEAGTGTVEIGCTPAPCMTAKMPFPQATPVVKNRYLSFIPPINEESAAIRVTAVALGTYSSFDGVSSWVGPPAVYDDPSVADPERTIQVSRLQCDPYFMVWDDVGELHVIGAEIIPESEYAVQVVLDSCEAYLAEEGVYSQPLSLTTGLWGDVTEVFSPAGGPTQPDFIDIAAIVEQFVAGPHAIGKPLAQLQPNLPHVERSVDFRDISAAVSAFVGVPYGFGGPCGCPSVVPCNQMTCTSDTDCDGVICLEGYCRDACGRCIGP